jgi:hypothetical protein
MLLSTEHIKMLTTHVADCDSAIRTLTAKVRTKKREDLFSNTSLETAQVISLMIQISDSQTAIFYAIRNSSAAIAA